MLDSAANRSVLRGRIAENLGLQTKTVPTKVTTFDAQIIGDRKFATFSVETLDGDCHFSIKDTLIRDILTTE